MRELKNNERNETNESKTLGDILIDIKSNMIDGIKLRKEIGKSRRMARMNSSLNFIKFSRRVDFAIATAISIKRDFGIKDLKKMSIKSINKKVNSMMKNEDSSKMLGLFERKYHISVLVEDLTYASKMLDQGYITRAQFDSIKDEIMEISRLKRQSR